MSTPRTDLRADPGSLEALVPAWRLSLRAANKSPKTIRTYLDAATQLHAFLVEQGMPTDVVAIRREHVETFIVHLTETRSASTAATRYRALQQLWRWLLEEGEVAESPMKNMRPPAVQDAPVPVLELAEQKRLLKACEGREFDDRRDRALILMLLDTGLRRAEAVGMTLDDVNLESQILTVVGKGNRIRQISFGAKTAAALSRYERARGRHRDAKLPDYWIGARGPLTDSGLAQILRRRCIKAGLEPVHPHVLRHSWAHQMLALGHNEGTLRVLGGWRTRDMLDRYGASLAGERAREAHRALSPGDLL